MSELSRDSAPAPDADGTERSRDSDGAASGSPAHANRRETEPFMVGVGDTAAIVDHIEIVDAAPTRIEDHSLAAYHFKETVAKLHDRAVYHKTGDPLAVRLDRRLFLPANTERRRLVEEDIRAMHGMELRDGRTLRVEEVLGRYGVLLGGMHEQLIEIRRRLDHSEQVRLAVRPANLSNEMYGQLGGLRHKYGGQLSFFVVGKRGERSAFRTRLARETFRARTESVRERLLAGEEVVLAIDSPELVHLHYREIAALQRQFGDRCKVEVDDSSGQSEAIIAALRDEKRRADFEQRVADSPDASIPEPPAIAFDHEERREWAKELAARTRKPWWQRSRLYRKLSGSRRT